MSLTDNKQSFVLLGKIATKLMNTYKQIKQICDQAPQDFKKLDNTLNKSFNQPIKNVSHKISNENQKNNQSDNLSEPEITQIHQKNQIKQIKSKQNESKTNNPININNQKTDRISVGQAKQKIGSNLSRIQQKMKSLPNNTDRAKKNTTNNQNTNNSSYLLYFQERQPQLSNSNPSMSITNICERINQQWKNMDPIRKGQYDKKVQINKNDFKIKLQGQNKSKLNESKQKHIESKQKHHEGKASSNKDNKKQGKFAKDDEQLNSYESSKNESDLQMMEDIYDNEDNSESE